MKPLRRPREAVLSGMGEHRPERIVDNAELASTLDTDDSWIRQRTGIERRHIAAGTETVVAMATEASRAAIADAGIDAADVGLVVLASCTMPAPIPGGAAAVAANLGARRAGAYDVNAACAGFCYALSTAADAVRLGTVDHAVIVASEKLSGVVDWSDRSSAILFGDGAGAVVVSSSPRPGIGPVVWGSDGGRAHLIGMTDEGRLRLDGPAVFRWATTSLDSVARAACDAAGVDVGDLAALVPHQANLRIVDAIVRQLGASHAVVADDIRDAGNTSAASIPLALNRLRDGGAVGSGDLALLLAFGAGLTWAATVVTVP